MDEKEILDAVRKALAEILGKQQPLPTPVHVPPNCPTEITIRIGHPAPPSACWLPPQCPTPVAAFPHEDEKLLDRLSQERGIDKEELRGQLHQEATSELVRGYLRKMLGEE